MLDARKLLGLVLRDAVGGALGGGRRRQSRRAWGLADGLQIDAGEQSRLKQQPGLA